MDFQYINIQPSTDKPLSPGRIVQETITVPLQQGMIFKDGEVLTVYNVYNLTMQLNSYNNAGESYQVKFKATSDPKIITATFYYEVDPNPKGEISFDFFSKYTPQQTVRYAPGPKVNSSSTNPTSYLFTTSNIAFPNPKNNSNNTAMYTVTVLDENKEPVVGYDVYWSDKLVAGILSKANVFTRDALGTYFQIYDTGLYSFNNDIPSPVFRTTTDSDGSTNIFVTSNREATNGVITYLVSAKDSFSLGTITVYDPDAPTLNIPSPLIQNITYKDGYVNLDGMTDPLQVQISGYRSSSDADTISLISNSMLCDSVAFGEIHNTSKTLTIAKSTLYSRNGPEPVDLPNKVLYVVAAHDGTVRTSVSNNFYAMGVNQDPNQPDPNIPRYSPAPVLPDIHSAYITKDDITGGVIVQYPFTNPTRQTLPGYYLTATYYLNGYITGTTIQRHNRIDRDPHKISPNEIKAGFYQDLLSPSELHGYSKSSTGTYLKLYIEYSISSEIDGGIINNYAINDLFYLSTVAPGDFS